MTQPSVRLLSEAFSFRLEARVIFWAFGLLCVLPVFLVALLTQAGFSLVSDRLVSSDPQTHAVEIRNPATGEVTDTVTGPFVWPVGGTVTLEFGQPDPPYQPLHTGIDIAGAVGDPVGAFMAGTVTYSGSQDFGYGTHVILDNGHGITSVYGHLSALNVTVGQQVQAGEVVGLRGSTGWSTGPHTHFEVRVFDIPVDPRVFLEGNPPNAQN